MFILAWVARVKSVNAVNFESVRTLVFAFVSHTLCSSPEAPPAALLRAVQYTYMSSSRSVLL